MLNTSIAGCKEEVFGMEKMYNAGTVLYCTFASRFDGCRSAASSLGEWNREPSHYLIFILQKVRLYYFLRIFSMFSMLPPP